MEAPMPLDTDRNRVLTSLRNEPEGADTATLAKSLGLEKDTVERHLLYCADYELIAWNGRAKKSGRAVITTRGRDYLIRQSL
jgi:predicted ArsR family transcriptional regulator